MDSCRLKYVGIHCTFYWLGVMNWLLAMHGTNNIYRQRGLIRHLFDPLTVRQIRYVRAEWYSLVHL